jgi:hypothetical protein
MRWSRQNPTSGEAIIENIHCFGLTMDDQNFLYVTDKEKREVRRYRMGETNGTVVAGGHGQGSRLNQLDEPNYVFVDRDHSTGWRKSHFTERKSDFSTNSSCQRADFFINDRAMSKVYAHDKMSWMTLC